MNRYESVIEGACADVETCCASCGEFVSAAASERIDINDSRLHLFKDSEDTLRLDGCCLQDAFYRFCQACFSAINTAKVPKFSAMNGANVTMCQYYPPELRDLTLVEESVISRCHPIGTVLKLKPNGIQNPTAYNAIRGHLIAIPQDPGPLLKILPSPELHFHDYIKIVWSAKEDPTLEDLRPFAEIRKDKVLRALVWLCNNNPLYKSVAINYDLIDQWEDRFVPPILENTIAPVSEDSDSSERGTYSADMNGLAENDLHDALNDMADNTIASGAVYSDIEGERLNPELKMVLTLSDMLMDSERHSSDSVTSSEVGGEGTPVISWKGNGRLPLINDYDDSEFFTGAFPTLFPYGKGGHICDPDQRSIPISLEAWGKWLLSHHSRRYITPASALLVYIC